jgi:hypothetical protein
MGLDLRSAATADALDGKSVAAWFEGSMHCSGVIPPLGCDRPRPRCFARGLLTTKLYDRAVSDARREVRPSPLPCSVSKSGAGASLLALLPRGGVGYSDASQVIAAPLGRCSQRRTLLRRECDTIPHAAPRRCRLGAP